METEAQFFARMGWSYDKGGRSLRRDGRQGREGYGRIGGGNGVMRKKRVSKTRRGMIKASRRRNR